MLATGGSESEIYIYDINSPGNPMTPGAKSQVCKLLFAARKIDQRNVTLLFKRNVNFIKYKLNMLCVFQSQNICMLCILATR